MASKDAHIGLKRLLTTIRCCFVALTLAPRLKSLRQELRRLELDLTAKNLEMSVMQQKYQTLVQKGLANAVVDVVNTKDTEGTAASPNSSTDGADDTPGVTTDAAGIVGTVSDADGTPGVGSNTDITPGATTDVNGLRVAATSSTATTTASDSSEPHLCPSRIFVSNNSTHTIRSLSQKCARCQQALVIVLRLKYRSSGLMN